MEGSLATIDRACSEVGVRVNACYGATDRWADDGSLHEKVSPLSVMTKSAQAGLDECDRHLREGKRGMVGLHAAFTCSDETIAAATALAKQHGVGVHVHVAEAVDDRAAGARLESHATDDWLLVHTVHLDRPLRGRIAHNPRSNMNNGVGYAQPTTRPNKVLLGSDGIGSDMAEESRLAYVRLREFDANATPDVVAAWMQEHDAYGKSGWKAASLCDEKACPIETCPVASQAETAIHAVWRGNRLLTPIGGGVTLVPRMALDEPNLLRDEKGEVKAAQAAVKLPETGWFWD
ncbi:hypothetical protein EBR04_10075 [bacterium]|nr:hypothetical protein [bacterium]